MKKSLLAVAIAAATGLGVSQNAQADAYAYAYNNLFNLVITSSTGIIPASSVFKLDNSASLTGFATEGNTGSFSAGTAPFNILDANLNIASTNSPAANGNLGPNYARSDASIVTSELNPGQPPTVSGNKTNVWAVAESYLDTAGNGAGSGTVGSTSTFQFVVTTPGTSLSFAFDAILDLRTCVDGPAMCDVSPAAFPTNAQASSGVSFTISQTGAGNVFAWAPGSAPTIGNGITASVNPFALTTTISRDQNNPGIATVSQTTVGGSQFFAQTALFQPGTYTLSLSDNKNVTTELTVEASEPETLALLGIGLLGMFAAARRKQA